MQQEGQQGAKQDGRGQHNAGRLWGTPFQPGTSGNPAGKSKARIAELVQEWAAEWGGVDPGSAAWNWRSCAALRSWRLGRAAIPKSKERERRTQFLACWGKSIGGTGRTLSAAWWRG
jgi:hypothetical protein